MNNQYFPSVEKIINDDQKLVEADLYRTALTSCGTKCFDNFKISHLNATEKNCFEKCIMNSLENYSIEKIK